MVARATGYFLWLASVCRAFNLDQGSCDLEERRIHLPSSNIDSIGETMGLKRERCRRRHWRRGAPPSPAPKRHEADPAGTWSAAYLSLDVPSATVGHSGVTLNGCIIRIQSRRLETKVYTRTLRLFPCGICPEASSANSGTYQILTMAIYISARLTLHSKYSVMIFHIRRRRSK